MVFIDTNVLVYAASGMARDQAKTAAARSLLSHPGEMAISVQVLNEFYHVARSPRKLGFNHEEALRYCAAWKNFTVVDVSLAVFENAMTLVSRWQLAFYDSLILSAAKLAQCDRLLSEDFSHGQDYGGIVVENPFLNL